MKRAERHFSPIDMKQADHYGMAEGVAASDSAVGMAVT